MELALIVIIVVAAVCYLGRRYVRQFKSAQTGDGCGCDGGCCGCDQAAGC